jgi:hypothetical protein
VRIDLLPNEPGFGIGQQSSARPELRCRLIECAERRPVMRSALSLIASAVLTSPHYGVGQEGN